MSGRSVAVRGLLAVGAVAGVVLVGGLLSGAPLRPPADPAAELPVVLDYHHGQGSPDLVQVDRSGAVVGWLGRQDGDHPVGCLIDRAEVQQFADAARAGLEPGAAEPTPDGADVERLEVLGPGGSAWLADGGNPATLVGNRLIQDLHRPAGERTICIETPATSPQESAAGLRLAVTTGHGGYTQLYVSPAGVVTGVTRRSAVSCRVSAPTADTLTTAPLPDSVGPLSDEPTVRMSRRWLPREAALAGADRLTRTAVPLLEDVQRPAADRSLCRPR